MILVILILLAVQFIWFSFLVERLNENNAARVAASEARIIAAFGERVSPEELKALRDKLASHVGPLKQAVEDAPKISG